jgi:hypothetical protein
MKASLQGSLGENVGQMETRYTDSIKITWKTDEMVVLMMI